MWCFNVAEEEFSGTFSSQTNLDINQHLSACLPASTRHLSCWLVKTALSLRKYRFEVHIEKRNFVHRHLPSCGVHNIMGFHSADVASLGSMARPQLVSAGNN